MSESYIYTEAALVTCSSISKHYQEPYTAMQGRDLIYRLIYHEGEQITVSDDLVACCFAHVSVRKRPVHQRMKWFRQRLMSVHFYVS